MSTAGTEAILKSKKKWRRRRLYLFKQYLNLKMMQKEKIEIKKEKKRIPLPKKPPKIEDGKNNYDRKKEKEKVRKIIRGEK